MVEASLPLATSPTSIEFACDMRSDTHEAYKASSQVPTVFAMSRPGNLRVDEIPSKKSAQPVKGPGSERLTEGAVPSQKSLVKTDWVAFAASVLLDVETVQVNG